MPGHSGESFDQMLRRVEGRRAGAAAEGAMSMPGYRSRPVRPEKGLAPAGKGAMAPAFGSKKAFGGRKERKGFAPASRAFRGGGR